MTKEEVIAAMKECAVAIGHAPSFPELRKMNVSQRAIRANFGTYKEALKACGMERRGNGYEISQLP